MNALTVSAAEALGSLAPQLSADSLARRETSLRRFQERGLPTTRLEDWRYTDLSALSERNFDLAGPLAAELSAFAIEGTDAQRFINGGEGAFLPPPETHDGLGALNASLARQGLDLRLSRGQSTPQPVNVITWCEGENVMAHLRHRIRLDENAEATVILQHAGRGSYFTTQFTEIELAAGARLRLYRIQDESDQAYQLSNTCAKLGRDARLEVVTIDLGGGLVRHDLQALIEQPGAEAHLYGLYAPRGTTHVDNHTRIDHCVPRGNSREFFRGVVADRARAIFNGKVVVHAGASKTDSEQRIANLLLSPTAEVNAKPELEIYNDDVKCAHGATCGQLDEHAIYYLRTRGLDRDAARSLLTCAFAGEILERIALEPLRQRVTRQFQQRLPGGALIEPLA